MLPWGLSLLSAYAGLLGNWIKEAADLIETPVELLRPILRGGKRSQHPPIGWIGVRDARMEPSTW